MLASRRWLSVLGRMSGESVHSCSQGNREQQKAHGGSQSPLLAAEALPRWPSWPPLVVWRLHLLRISSLFRVWYFPGTAPSPTMTLLEPRSSYVLFNALSFIPAPRDRVEAYEFDYSGAECPKLLARCQQDCSAFEFG